MDIILRKKKMMKRHMIINYDCGHFATIESLFRGSRELNLTTTFYIQDDRMKWDFWHYGAKWEIERFFRERGIIKGGKQ